MRLCVTEYQAFYVLCGVFGSMHPHGWPVPPRGHFCKADERIDKALKLIGSDRTCDAAFRDVHWTESRKGQYVHEDAGGYMWRCWAASIGFLVADGTTYSQAISELLTDCPPEEVEDKSNG